MTRPRPSGRRSGLIQACAPRWRPSLTWQRCATAVISSRRERPEPEWQDCGVHAYSRVAAFYAQIMGERAAEGERIRTYIKRCYPSARSLPELGFGTRAM